MATLNELQKFIKEIAKTGLYKIEIKTEEFTLKIQSQPELKVQSAPQVVAQPQLTLPQPTPQAQQSQPQQTVQQKEKTEKKSEDEGLVAIKSPMVGTFYRRPAPDKPPFVEVGDHIKKGDVVCIIEAMKIFNEIESEVSGEIVKILVEDASPVEYDQPLFLVKPE